MKKSLKHPELVEDLHRRRVDGVSTKIAEEIRMLLENADIAARAGEEQTRHHARRPSADDD
jgi:hypothetical protein